MIRKNINNNWLFYDESEGSSPFGGNFKAQTVSLPHDAVISTKRSEMCINQNTTGFYTAGNYSYIKKFEVPYEDKNKVYILEFESVYTNAMVFVNGAHVETCLYGYRDFFIDISRFLIFGSENEVKVTVKCMMNLTSRWYSGGGIIRNVNLYIGEQLHIEHQGLKIEVLDMDHEGALLKCRTTINYSGYASRTATLKTIILDANGNEFAVEQTVFTIYQNESADIQQRIYIKEPTLWNIENPYLYQIKTILIYEDEILDELLTPYGIRRLQLDHEHGLRINGKVTKLRGACIHHDNGLLGAATFTKAEFRRIRRLKEAGFNAIRSAHQPASKAMLEACDQYGMLVMDECFDMWSFSKSAHDYALYFHDNWEKDIKSMVMKDYNHACVFMYSIGNEISEIGSDDGSVKNRRIAQFVRSLDNTRYVGNAINGTFAVMDKIGLILKDIIKEPQDTEKDMMDINELMTALDRHMPEIVKHDLVTKALDKPFGVLDICGYNYMESRYEMDGVNYPNRVIVGSETNPDHIGSNWEMVEKYSHVIGDFTWTGWDYIGESGVGRTDYTMDYSHGIYGPYPWYLAYCGDIDICGNRRPQSFYREIVFGLRKDPYIAVLRPQHYGKKAVTTNWSWSDSIPSWTWHGQEGNPIRIEVYADADVLSLNVNGNALKQIKPEKEMPYLFVYDAIYEPGIIEAVAYKNNKEIGRSCLKTAGVCKKILLIPEEERLIANEQELIYINTQLVDEQNCLSSVQDMKIQLSIEGPGCIQGFGSADPQSLENFYDLERTTFDGKALVIVRSTGESGLIKLTAYNLENNLKTVIDIPVVIKDNRRN